MGKPVEVRVLSRALTLAAMCSKDDLRGRASNCSLLVGTRNGYFDPAFLLAAQRAFINSESLFRPAGVSVPFFRAEGFCIPAAFLLAAQRAFINWESFLRPAGVS
jgi:hypothetical protein